MKQGKTIVKQIGETFRDGKRLKALYLCECGNQKVMRIDQVRSGNSLSCGCLQREFARSGAAHMRHGLANTRFWRIWSDMKRRTLHHHRSDYHRYGGRGISFSETWKDFEKFRDDMYESYLAHVKEHGEKNTSLDRVDVNGNYCKENCRWATWRQQANNTSTNVHITFRGQTKTQEEWSRELGVGRNEIARRRKKGLPLDAKYENNSWTTKQSS